MEKTLDKGVSKRIVTEKQSDSEELPRLMRIRSNGLILKKVKSCDVASGRTIVASNISTENHHNNNKVPSSKTVAKVITQSNSSKENIKRDASTQSRSDLRPLCAEHNQQFQSKKAKKGYSSDVETTNNSAGVAGSNSLRSVRNMNHRNIFNFVSVKCENEEPIPDNDSGKSSGPVRNEQKPVPALAGDGGSCQILSISIIMNNDRAIEFYTGMQNNNKFECALESLGRDAYDLQYYDNNLSISLTVPDQFLLTLALLRQHKSHYEMSILFNVTLKDIKNIFITWVRFMRLEWNKIPLPEPYKPMEVPVATSDIAKKRSKKLESDKSKSPKSVTIDLADDKASFKKVYKILNGPQNYIEAHLMDDIIYICHVLCFFKASKLQSKIPGSSSNT